MAPVCLDCGGTGSTTAADLLDCRHCSTASQRAALEAAIKAEEARCGPMDRAHRDWFCATWKPLAAEPMPMATGLETTEILGENFYGKVRSKRGNTLTIRAGDLRRSRNNLRDEP